MWFSCFRVLPGSAEAQVIWGGIIKCLLITYFIGNISAKKISKSIHVRQSYSKPKVGRFLRHGVYWSRASVSVCLCVCLSAHRRIPALLHGPGCNLGNDKDNDHLCTRNSTINQLAGCYLFTVSDSGQRFSYCRLVSPKNEHFSHC